MANAIVGFPRWTAGATFAAPASATGYPVANLGTLPLAYPWRSVDATTANTQVSATFAVKRKIDFVVLCRHNLSIDATVTVERYDDAALTTLIDSKTVKVWPPVFTADQVDWDGGRWWDRTYTEEEIEGYPWHLPIKFDDAHYAGGVKVLIDDTLNAQGFVQIGLLELATAHSLGVNFAVGAQYGYHSRTETQEADGGTEYHRRKAKPRVFEGGIDYIERDAALGNWLEMRRQLDVDLPFFWWPDPADETNQLRNSYLARFTELSLHSYATYSLDGVPIRLKEIL